MDEIIEFYGKYNEEKRLLSPYGRVEFLVTMKYLKDLIGERKGLRILDIGAGTGRYTLPLAELGHEVTAIDLTPYNVGILKQKAERAGIRLSARIGNALNLKKEESGSYDLILLFGPLYHLFSEDEKERALSEAKRLLKPGGTLCASYIMNDFAVVQFGFLENNAESAYYSGKLSADFRVQNEKKDLFSYDRPEDLDRYNAAAGLTLLKRIAQDGPTHYMRSVVTEMSEETFDLYLRYVLSTAERKDLVGASCHVMDVLAVSE
ncbi:MAG: class I SAM-dependent methyltransferase [Lachnospiraceae bacterium]|nr:class I SAM-dependent methyltransferase [Lachnospiraceae bacterium]